MKYPAFQMKQKEPLKVKYILDLIFCTFSIVSYKQTSGLPNEAERTPKSQILFSLNFVYFWYMYHTNKHPAFQMKYPDFQMKQKEPLRGNTLVIDFGISPFDTFAFLNFVISL